MLGAYFRHHGSSVSKSGDFCCQLRPSGEDFTRNPAPVVKHHHVSPSLMTVGSCAESCPVSVQDAANDNPGEAVQSRTEAIAVKNGRPRNTLKIFMASSRVLFCFLKIQGATPRRTTLKEFAGSVSSNLGPPGENAVWVGAT